MKTITKKQQTNTLSPILQTFEAKCVWFKICINVVRYQYEQHKTISYRLFAKYVFLFQQTDDS